jgi:hypothetical protein
MQACRRRHGMMAGSIVVPRRRVKKAASFDHFSLSETFNDWYRRRNDKCNERCHRQVDKLQGRNLTWSKGSQFQALLHSLRREDTLCLFYSFRASLKRGGGEAWLS